MSTSWAFHLPGFEARRGAYTTVPGSLLEIPTPDPEAIESVWRRVEAGAAAWRARPIAERIERLAAACEALAVRGPGAWEKRWLRRSTTLSPDGLAAAWTATFAPHDAAALRAALAAEPEVQSAAPRGRIVHVLSGNALPPTCGLLVRGLLVGAPQWLRPASREPFFALAMAAAWRDIAPELAECFAVLWWEHASAVEAAVLASAAVVTVQGSDASVAAVEARVRDVSPGARCVGYGSRWSLALVSRQAQTLRTAYALATDVALFDQQGCLSPQLILAEDSDNLQDWCREFAGQLAAAEVRLPRGKVPEDERARLRSWRERQWLRSVFGDLRGWWGSDGTSAWAVSLMASPQWEDPPLHRHVPVVPFVTEADVMTVLGERLPRLQGVAADLAGWEKTRAESLLAALHPTRVAPPGELQLAPAGWRQDHHPPLASLIATHGRDTV